MAEKRFGTIYNHFNKVVDQYGDNEALIYLGEKFTYKQLKNAIDRVAQGFYNHGIRKQDKVIIYLAHNPQWIISWLALQKIGAVVIPVTHFYGNNEISYIANDSGAETIICMDTNFGYVIRALSDSPLKRVYITNIVDHVPWWKVFIGKLYNKIPEGSYELDANTFRYRDLLKSSSTALPEISITEEDICEMIYTGGTTGDPKGIPISHNLFLDSLDEQRKVSETVIPRGEDVVIQGAPLYHILGQAVGLGAIMSGDTLILLPRVNLDALFNHIEKYKATTFFGTPTLYRMILEHDRVEYYDLNSVRYYFSGGDVLPNEVEKRWNNMFKQPIYQGYGATETCGGVTLSPAGEKFPPGTAGKVLPNKEIKVIDPDTLEDVGWDQGGELLVHSANMVKGYWNKPEETKTQFIELDGKLWYRTGDIVRIDEKGWMFFMDRSADVIKHKGYRVAASKIDSVLQDHHAVIASCCVGVPDPNVGERIKAFVILKEDVKGISASELIAFCRGKLASYEVPQYIEFRDMLPKSKVGKLLRRELRAEERIKQTG